MIKIILTINHLYNALLFYLIYENNIINIVLSKLEFIPKHYKIIRKKNIIIIKCHHYSDFLYCDIKHKNIIIYKTFNGTDYTNEYKDLDNYDITKTISIIIFDIIIDLTNKNYKMITSYFTIINCKNDLDNLYNKLIDKLNSKSYYIEINNIYDNNLNFNNYLDERIIEPIMQKQYTEINHKMHNCIGLKNESINIIIKNDTNNDHMIINSMFNYLDKFNITISNTIDTKPHIYNNHGDIRLYKITGSFI